MQLDGVLRRGSVGQQVRQVQELLNLGGSRPPLQADGHFGEMTERSVRYFQSSHGLGVDGIVGQQTVRELERVSRARSTQPQPAAPTSPNGSAAPAAPTADDASAPNGDFCFPLARYPSPDWRGGARYFGAPRSGGRLHAACDLLAPVGTTIYAVADGELVRSPYYFYSNTYAVEIQHGNFLVRYGEILGGSYKGGQTVRKGQPIAKVGRLDSGSSMLHFELYSRGNDHSSLTTGSGPYRRRGDVINASSYLETWSRNLPG